MPDDGGLALATRDGRLLLAEVQPAGGRPMTGDEFVRGRPAILGQAVRLASERSPGDTAQPSHGGAGQSSHGGAAQPSHGDPAGEPA